jgi:uncharacterized protein
MELFAEIFSIGSVIILGLILIILGYLGSVLPALPGVPLALISVWLVHLTGTYQYAWYVLASITIMALGVSLVDYVLPIWGTKKYGGSKYGVRGSTIGLVVGVLLSVFVPAIGMLGLLLGPFVGAFVGEKYAKADNKVAFRSAIGSFMGFVAGTLGKIFATTIITLVFLYGIIKFFLQ